MTGDGFAAASPLTVTVDGARRASLRASAVGSFRTAVRVTGPGTRLISVSGVEPSGRARVVSDPVTVVALEAISTRAARSPEVGTGRSVTALLAGFGLVLLYSVVRLAVRVRSDHPSRVLPRSRQA